MSILTLFYFLFFILIYSPTQLLKPLAMRKQLGTTTQGVYQFGMVHSALKVVLVILKFTL
jgi:hypothetical protein